MRRTLAAAALAGVVALTGCQRADLVLTNGRIVTVDDRLGTVEALAVRGDRILAVGSVRQIARLIDTHTRVIDLDGRMAMPGFIDGHAHFLGLGESRLNLDLRPARTWDDVVEQVRIAAATTPPGTWILGRGWHQDKWDPAPVDAIEGFPRHASLSAATPDHPVWLAHASGHAAAVNALAMEWAGIDDDTPDPAGGNILRDGAGHAIGILRENAEALVARAHRATESAHPEAAAARTRQALRLADEECRRKGVTSVQDAGSSFDTIDVIRELIAGGHLTTRLWIMASASNDELARRLPAYRTIGDHDQRLTVRAVKRWLDGALGSRGAWLLQPYDDDPTSTGLATLSIDALRRTGEIARANHCQVCVHAIGDRANRAALDVFEQAFDNPEALAAARWRIEHAQHLHPDDIPRFARLGVIASMQGVHCPSDAAFVIDRLGEDRARSGAYAWRALWDAGALVANGTDAPVEDIDPIATYHAMVTRQPAHGAPFFPEQRLTRMEALQAATINAARAAFEESVKGSLTPGKLADIVILSNDILHCAEETIPGTRVDATISGGVVVYER